MDNMLVREVNKNLNKTSYELIKLFHTRFEIYVRLRISNQSKLNQWSLLLSKKYIIIIAVIMVLFDHTKREVKYLDETTTLLSTPINYLLTLNV